VQVRAGEHGVELVVGGERLLAHQADLATASPLLSRVLGSTCTILLPDYSTTPVHSLLWMVQMDGSPASQEMGPVGEVVRQTQADFQDSRCARL